MPNDRFEQQAKRELATPWVLNQPRLAMLLRRQHAAYVRLVKRTTNGGVDENMKANILAALARYRKGTR